LDLEFIDPLRAELARRGDVALAILFGSHAKGSARADSDVDLGVIPLIEWSLGQELQIAAALSSVVGSEVDLVRIDVDDPLLGHELVETGRCVYEYTPGRYAAYRARAHITWLEFDEVAWPHRQAFLRRVAGK
jgi:predicted nucleotidyltransferase